MMAKWAKHAVCPLGSVLALAVCLCFLELCFVLGNGPLWKPHHVSPYVPRSKGLDLWDTCHSLGSARWGCYMRTSENSVNVPVGILC